MTTSTKTCDTCGEEKPRTQFRVHRKAADGRDNHCKSCRAAMHQAKKDAPSVHPSIERFIRMRVFE